MKTTQLLRIFFLWSVILYSGVAAAQVAGRPNIVVIMVDDGRYDEYRPTGAPEWFVAPNIERIANEGANFTRTYAPTPLCGPSRASVYTGLYSTQHKTFNNGTDLDTTLTFIQDVLKSEGYYTGFIGKYGNGFPAPLEFDYWVDIGDQELYKNIWIKVNGDNVFVSGHITNSFNDYINDFMDSAAVHNDQPFALFFFPLAPHTPNTPRATDAGLYIDETMPFPENFEAYTDLYPDYYAEGLSIWDKDTAGTNKFIRDRFACLIGVDDNVSKIFDHLDTLGITDSTFIMFTSDNGYIIGEHRMRAKALPVEESMHVPMFIRYPEWFPTPDTISDDFVELIDIAKTLLDVVGVEDTFGFMGHSMKALAESDTLRPYAYYVYEGADPGAASQVPDLRGVRSFEFMYVYANCDCWTEQLYDMVNDPGQNTNVVLEPDYYDQLQAYRSILDSLRISYQDTAAYLMLPCNLVNAFEVPDDIDNDCDGLVDDSLFSFIRYIDTDGDGFGDPDSSLIIFGELPGYVNNSNDCNDTTIVVNPSSLEICDGMDNDCDGLIDDADMDITGQTTWYADADGDLFGNYAVSLLACVNPGGYVTAFGDCNDADPLITTGTIEICNTLDDDCDGLTDADDPDVADATLYYADTDGDTFGDNTLAQWLCAIAPGFVLDDTDCDDTNAAVNPLAVEVCDGIDNNCNGLLDDDDPLAVGLTLFYFDFDDDGWGNFYFWTFACSAPPGYTFFAGDCNDFDPDIHPWTPDYCDGVNNDCDFFFDEDVVIPVVTADGPLTFCSGESVIFTATPDIPDFDYQWYKSGTPIAGATNSTYEAISSGAYKVKYTAPAGCVTNSGASSVTVNNNPKPSISTISISNDLCVNNPVKLSTKNKIGSTFQWQNAGVDIAGATTNKYNATTTGYYRVRQTDINGCVGLSKNFAVVQTCKETVPYQEDAQQSMAIYPNPTTGIFTVDVHFGVELQGDVHIRLYSVIGELVFEQNFSCANGMLSAEIETDERITSGLYTLEASIQQYRMIDQVVIEK